MPQLLVHMHAPVLQAADSTQQKRDSQASLQDVLDQNQQLADGISKMQEDVQVLQVERE